MADKPLPKNPVGLVKGLVDGVKQWFENADAEELEYRMELVRARPPDGSAPKDLLGGTPGAAPKTPAEPKMSRNDVVPVLRKESAPAPAPLRIDGLAPPPRAEKPLPPGALPLPPIDDRPPAPPPRVRGESPKHPAGMRYSKEFRRQGSDPAAVRFSKADDTSYLERNQTVLLIKQRYAHLGHTIASAMLTKFLMPRGAEIIMEKMGLRCTGDDVRDHDLIGGWIEAHGEEELCRALGVRYDAAKFREEQRRHQIREEQRRRLAEDARKEPGQPPAASVRPHRDSTQGRKRRSSPPPARTAEPDSEGIALPPDEPPPPE